MKRLHSTKGFVLGVALTLVMSILVVPGLAASFTKNATLNYNDIKITLNDQAITPKDADGNVVDPFIIDGTTYLPVRGIANALGMGVAWDGATSTVKLTDNTRTTGTIDIKSGSIYYDKDGNHIRIEFTNNMNVALSSIVFQVYCYDENDVLIGKRGAQILRGITRDIAVGEGRTSTWSLDKFAGVHSVNYFVVEYTTADGVTVALPQDSQVWRSASF